MLPNLQKKQPQQQQQTIHKNFNEMTGKFSNIEICGINLNILKRYTDVSYIAAGSQGIVLSASDQENQQQKVAIKKLTGPFFNAITAKRACREFFLLEKLKHKNIIHLLNAYTPQKSLSSFNELYFVTEKMDANLCRVMKLELDHEHISFIIYQILCGLNYLHRSEIIHRDLKPSNIIVNLKCEIKIIDLGFARNTLLNDNAKLLKMTPNVVTRYYRAPEIILSTPYTTRACVWSLGCIFVELILGRIFFCGNDELDQWTKIVQIVGSPSAKFCEILSPQIKEYIKSQSVPPQLWTDVLKNSDFPPAMDGNLNAKNARDLISKMLVIDETDRIGINAAINHPYINIWYDANEVNKLLSNEDIEFIKNMEKKEQSVEEWKKDIYEELAKYQNFNNIEIDSNS